ncbi:MAG: T9SS C-terminal target domain-containing protein [Calditrichaeota bacterium]|nr:MAG: T9SS C-terminal target domain-containing protein [Calditrichota bacterium]
MMSQVTGSFKDKVFNIVALVLFIVLISASGSALLLAADDVILVPESATKRVLVPKSSIDSAWKERVDLNDSSWKLCTGSPGGVGYEKSTGYESLITLDVGDDMYVDGGNPNSSCYIRIPFTVNSADLATVKFMTLSMRYDDGFAAYLNGSEIARANVSDPLVWNSSTQNSNESSGQATFDVSSHFDQVVIGENLLAIHGVNSSTSSTDFIINAELSAGSQRYGDFTSSNLPIIVINTHGQQIVDEQRIVADMGIIYNGPGERNDIDDPFNHYNGKIGIELRGATSQGFPKQPYRLETIDSDGNNNNVSLFGMPEENDWVLHNPYYDKSLMRNIVAYHLSSIMGHYAPRTQPCEVFLNNDYQGVYVFMEKIKRDKNRVDIADLDADDVAGDSLTGGYIIKIDKPDGEQNDSWSGKNVSYQYHYPKPAEIRPEQKAYIKKYILDFERIMQTRQFDDPAVGYPGYLDMSSLVDFFIINEVTRNVDGYRISTYIYKDKDKDNKVAKLKMGPIWDFDLSLGVTNWDGNKTEGWNLDYLIEKTAHEYTPPFWWAMITNTQDFQSRLLARWTELRQSVFDVESLHSYIDTVADALDEAQVRNFARWNQGVDYSQEVDYIKTWLAGRIAWMDENITGEVNGGGGGGGGETPTADDITDALGTIVAQYNDSPSGEEIDKLIDNNLNTKYLTFHESSWIEYRHPQPVVTNGYGIISANDAPNRDPRNWQFQAWDDGASKWITLHTVANEQMWTERLARKIFSFNNSEPYSRYRLNISALNGDDRMQMAELEIYAKVVIDSDDITDLGGTIAGSNDHLPWTGPNSDGSPDAERIEKLIDNDVNTKYLVGAEQSWITYTIAEKARVTAYSITSANDAPTRDPRSWQLQGWDTAANSWVTLHSVSNQSEWEERFQTKIWQFENANKWYNKYRLNILEINGDSEGLMQMAELEIFGDLFMTTVADETMQVNEYSLEQNYPNPFNPTTSIQFSIPKSTHVTLTVYNVMGQKVRVLVDHQMTTGLHTAQWDGLDESGTAVANSIYFYHLKSEFGVIKKKMLFVK